MEKSFLKQLYYLLYKNYLFKIRNKRQTFGEICIVLYFVLILAVVKLTSRQDLKEEIAESSLPTFDVKQLPTLIGYVQKGTDPLLNDLVNTLKGSSNASWYRFSTEGQLDEFYQKNERNFSIGIILEHANTDSLTYFIKTPAEKIVDPGNKESNRGKCRSPGFANWYGGKWNCPADTYIATGFSALQSFVDSKFIQVLTKQKTSVNLNSTWKMFPKHEFQPSSDYLKNVVSIYMNVAFAPYILFLLTNIVTEKENKIKESMKIMGLNMMAYWLSWFITYAVVIFIGCVLSTAVSIGVKLYGDSQFFIIFLLLFFYGLSIITLSFMFTMLFKKAKTAGMFGSLSTILLSLLSLIHIYADTSNAVKWLTCLLSPVALSLGLTSGLDSKHPLTFSNITSLGEFPPINALVMLLIDTILYLLLALYLDAVFPGEYGKPRHPLFICSLSFWKNIFKKKDAGVIRQSSLKSPSLEDEDQGNFEEIPEDALGARVISINGLRKSFKQGKKKPDLQALDGVNMNVFEGQITALLGHNGAGKSTLISILTGMLSPSQGTAELYGFNIRDSNDMDNIRQMIGVCPQQNILFDQLNPREHLTLFAGIKGLAKDLIATTVERVLKEIGLGLHATTLAASLSGGQKRKLCVGIALIGEPKVVFLDEPTSGMDPSSRRQMWSLLQSKRENRVIFLTTHFMDEADVLADYKAIMSKGKIRCAGTSLFLKSRFGIGYHLGMVVDKQVANLDQISDLITEHVPGAELSRFHGKELAYRLPLAQVHKFSDLFQAFENSNTSNEIFSCPSLGITSYGVSMTTLEEVFLKLEEPEEDTDDFDNKEHEDRQNSLLIPDVGQNTMLIPGDSVNTVYGSTAEFTDTQLKSTERQKVSPWMQLMTLLEIRMWLTLRSPGKLFWQAVFPGILLVVGLVLFRNLSSGSSASADLLKLEPSLYLRQGVSPSAGSTDVIWKLLKSDATEYLEVKKAFAAINLMQRNVSHLDLIKLAPHTIAYEVTNVDMNGMIGYGLRYNDTQVHSIPVGVNTISNAMLHLASIKKNISILPITTYSKPFKSRKPEWKFDGLGQAAVMLVGLSFVAMAGGFSIEVIMTRQNGIRQQLRVSGMNRCMYWLQFFVGDLIFYIIPVVILYIAIPAIDITAFNMSTAMGAVFLLLIMYIPTSLLFSYTLSFMFDKYETGQNVIPTIINMAAIIPYYVVSSIDMASGSLEKSLHATVAIIISVLDPPFTIMAGLYYVARAYRVESIIQQKTDVFVPSSKYFGWYANNALPAVYIIILVQLLLLTWAVYAIDCYKAGGKLVFPLAALRDLKCKLRKRKSKRTNSEQAVGEGNTDVMQEKQKVIDCIVEDQVNSMSVVAQGLNKQFKNKKVVSDLHMMVNRGEIFGILGPNGAGKTTTLNMITADLHADRGQIFVDGHNIATELTEAFHSLGYCPQIDALWETITVRQHLKCFGLVKGIPPAKIQDIVAQYGEALKITEHMDKQAKELSGGTKRKLSFLMSMIGDANVIIMDEPSCGMDPSARRFLWTSISANTVGARGVILTTHSMEEADALCARVGIMVKGEMKCVGTTQELKTNYGQGYQLEVKFKTRNMEHHEDRKLIITDYVLSVFPNAVETEYFGSRITYKVPMSEIQNLSFVFSRLEEGKDEVSIEEYSFSQSTLEQVFLSFAKEQDDDFTGKQINSLEV